MRAVVFSPAGERVEDRPEPSPRADEVLIKVEYCGICGSDLHAAEPDFRPGVVMGHELTGTVLAYGAEVEGLGVGDHVVVNPNGDVCGRCGPCRRGERNMCRQVWETAVGLARDGGLAPFATVRATTVHRLPDGVDLRSATLIEPLSVALRTVRSSGIRVGQDAIVFGGGPIGLLVTTILRAAGAGRIVVVEPTAARREIAVRQGATEVIDPRDVDLAGLFEDPDSAPAFAYECSGIAELVGTAVEVLKPRGVLTVTGFSRRPPSFDAAHLLFKEIQVRGSFIYIEEFGEAIELLASGRIDLTPLVSGVVDIDDAHIAFDRMRHSSDAVKYLISAHNSDPS